MIIKERSLKSDLIIVHKYIWEENVRRGRESKTSLIWLLQEPTGENLHQKVDLEIGQKFSTGSMVSQSNKLLALEVGLLLFSYLQIQRGAFLEDILSINKLLHSVWEQMRDI